MVGGHVEKMQERQPGGERHDDEANVSYNEGDEQWWLQYALAQFSQGYLIAKQEAARTHEWAQSAKGVETGGNGPWGNGQASIEDDAWTYEHCRGTCPPDGQRRRDDDQCRCCIRKVSSLHTYLNKQLKAEKRHQKRKAQIRQASYPTNPSSSPTTLKMKSVCCSGRKSKAFCVPAVKPFPHRPPLPTATMDWIR